MTVDINELFDEVIDLPDPTAQRRYASLIGLDDVKAQIHKQARILLKPTLLDTWANEHHGGPVALADVVRDRPPLFIFGGDVGTGETTLAETFGDQVARTERLAGGVRLMRLSLNARGSGTVGEMTTLITRAFAAVEEQAPITGSGDATRRSSFSSTRPTRSRRAAKPTRCTTRTAPASTRSSAASTRSQRSAARSSRCCARTASTRSTRRSAAAHSASSPSPGPARRCA